MSLKVAVCNVTVDLQRFLEASRAHPSRDAVADDAVGALEPRVESEPDSPILGRAVTDRADDLEGRLDCDPLRRRDDVHLRARARSQSCLFNAICILKLKADNRAGCDRCVQAWVYHRNRRESTDMAAFRNQRLQSKPLATPTVNSK
eukprot:1845371-Pleurochrysis_carterae.AAC.1